MYIFLNIISIIIVFFIGADIFSLADEIAYCKESKTSLLKRKYSTCRACGHRLRIKDTFPVVSRFVNKGICRFCDAELPKRGFTAELCGGMLAVIVYTILYFVLKMNVLLTIVFMVLAVVICMIAVVWYFIREDKMNNKDEKNDDLPKIKVE
ncbi:MAG: prepilin peptidase [Lachnospiraceae bacterium]|nr:prepilin peptidase [Lachnospiraceae bacterium]